MGQPGKCLVFFHEPTPTLAEAGARLAARSLDVKYEANRLTVRWGDGPELWVSKVTGKPVPADAQRAADSTGHKEWVSSSTGWFEIEFESLDEVLDEVNTLIEVQLTLQMTTTGVIYRVWNDTIQGPEE